MAINWSEWEDLTEEQYREKWDKLSFKDRKQYLHEYVAVKDVEIRGKDPNQSTRVVFWARAKGQHYYCHYDPKSDELCTYIHGMSASLDVKTIKRIKESLMKAIGREYGCNRPKN